MNYIIKLLGGCCLLLVSCQRDEIEKYEQNAGVYFVKEEFFYSFADESGIDFKSIQLEVSVTGFQDTIKDRTFKVAVLDKDTKTGELLTTATRDQYEIGNAVVPQGEFVGKLSLILHKDNRLDDSVYCICLEIQPSIDFPESELNKVNMKVFFSNQLLPPANWNWLKLYFGGIYSTAWWSFIRKVTGLNQLPYEPTLHESDPETWWMTVSQVKNYAAMVKLALENYNVNHPDDPLRHDDGEAANEKIVFE